MNKISVVGPGLFRCEVAWQLAKFNLNVTLYEMKPKNFSKAHKSENLAKLVPLILLNLKERLHFKNVKKRDETFKFFNIRSC